MPLTLTIVTGPTGQGERRFFDADQVSLGRGSGNDWILDDPERQLSRCHCRIERAAGSHVVVDLSANGAFLNGARLARTPSPLNDGDRLGLGDYILQVAIDQEPKAEVDPWCEPMRDVRPASLGVETGLPPSPFESLAADPLPRANGPADIRSLIPDDDFLTPFRESEPIAKMSPRIAPQQEAFAPAKLLPDDWMSELEQGPQAVAPESPPPAIAAEPPTVKPTEAPAPPPLVIENAPGEEAAAPVQADAAPEPVAETAAVADNAAPLWDAFLRGTGLDPTDFSDADREAGLEAAGRLLRLMTEGLRDMLHSRAEIKAELGVEGTVIAGRANNPMKFAENLDATMLLLLRANHPGYLPPEQAVLESVQDIKAHLLAYTAGMRGALDELMEQFDPERLKQRLSKRSVLSAVLPGARAARYWELYEALYGEMSSELKENFSGAFGRSVAAAYEEQIRGFG
ncbi:MAG: type VI secretion system-associated FHA domain protein TagH [Alphaproteobacteria bacterium]|nr:type VI secretion system-associated FHA domain protein TagH [Alphaproteobacteria bacterium]